MATQRRARGSPKSPRHFLSIDNAQRRVTLPIPALRRFLSLVHGELRLHPTSTFVRFVTDAEMQRLNSRFRHKFQTTDVLSFPSEIRTTPRTLFRRTIELRGQFLGDIAISPSVARRNARAFQRTLVEELCILMLHGILHLLGYDHETDRGEMDRVEAKLRRRLGLT